MRDPDRIRRMLDKIETEWLRYPDTRLGQLLSIMDSEFGRFPFYREDADLERGLDAFIKNRKDPS